MACQHVVCFQGEFKTKWGLKAEEFDRLKKATDGHEEAMSEAKEKIKAQKKKIKQLQSDLDMSGFGDSKQKSTVQLLRANVETLESNIRSKDFEIRKLTNNLKAMGGGQEAHKDENDANVKLLEKQVL